MTEPPPAARLVRLRHRYVPYHSVAHISSFAHEFISLCYIVGATKGFFGGLAMGVAGGAALAVGGVATGVSQVARGIYHTPGNNIS